MLGTGESLLRKVRYSSVRFFFGKLLPGSMVRGSKALGTIEVSQILPAAGSLGIIRLINTVSHKY